jgi:hypothetical protein
MEGARPTTASMLWFGVDGLFWCRDRLALSTACTWQRDAGITKNRQSQETGLLAALDDSGAGDGLERVLLGGR